MENQWNLNVITHHLQLSMGIVTISVLATTQAGPSIREKMKLISEKFFQFSMLLKNLKYVSPN